MDLNFDTFYAAYHKCPETRDAISQGKVSVSKKNLSSKPPSKAYRSNREDSVSIPPPFDLLLKLQHPDGKWKTLAPLLRCLDIDPSLKMDNMEEWEQATAFALAKIRQRYDLFDILGDAHDRAFKWLHSTKLINEALDIITDYENMPQTSSPSSKSKYTITEIEIKQLTSSFVQEKRNNMIAKFLKTHSTILALQKGISNSNHKEETVTDLNDDSTKNKLNGLLEIPVINYSSMISACHYHIDCLRNTEKQLISDIVMVDNLLEEIKRCITRCMHLYNTRETHTERNKSFEELQYSLGDDVPPRPGLDGWMLHGKKGYRQACLNVCQSLDKLADNRIILRKILQLMEIHKDAVPEMRKCIEEASSMLLPTPPPHTYPLTEQWRLHSHEWIFMWNGVDVIVHIVTSLNFLGNHPVLAEWYGKAYPFMSNPLSLCVPSDVVYERIITDEKIDRHINRCCRKAQYECDSLNGIINDKYDTDTYVLERQDSRILRDDLLHTQDIITKLCKASATWWPLPSDISDLDNVLLLFNTFIVIQIRTRNVQYLDSKGSLASTLYRIAESKVNNDPLSQTAAAVSMSSASHATVPFSFTTLRPVNQSSIKEVVNKHKPESFKEWVLTEDWIDDILPDGTRMQTKNRAKPPPIQHVVVTHSKKPNKKKTGEISPSVNTSERCQDDRAINSNDNLLLTPKSRVVSTGATPSRLTSKPILESKRNTTSNVDKTNSALLLLQSETVTAAERQRPTSGSRDIMVVRSRPNSSKSNNVSAAKNQEIKHMSKLERVLIEEKTNTVMPTVSVHETSTKTTTEIKPSHIKDRVTDDHPPRNQTNEHIADIPTAKTMDEKIISKTSEPPNNKPLSVGKVRIKSLPPIVKEKVSRISSSATTTTKLTRKATSVALISAKTKK